MPRICVVAAARPNFMNVGPVIRVLAGRAAEGAPAAWVHLVGNTMIDTLLANLDRDRAVGAVQRQSLGIDRRYGLLTLHRCVSLCTRARPGGWPTSGSRCRRP